MLNDTPSARLEKAETYKFTLNKKTSNNRLKQKTHITCFLFMVAQEKKAVSNDIIFADKLYLCAQLLGARSDLLATIGSWRREANDEQTFESLDSWIDTAAQEQQQSLDYVIKLHKK